MNKYIRFFAGVSLAATITVIVVMNPLGSLALCACVIFVTSWC